ncbi:MAG: efflux RND transporter periplasmic adaptor subunit [Kiritimatiellae bacterium]|nr:efflux RND transporter periplasmic adaptor subunit [Kiritimatiellia bacterium]
MNESPNAEIQTSSESDSGARLNLWLRIVLCLLILTGAGVIVWVIFSTEPEAVRVTSTRETAMLVEVEAAERGNFRPVIEVMGTVVPAREVMLQPRVSGKVLELSPHFIPGGVVEAGETLLTLDPATYQIALRERKSVLSQARADLTLEEGRQEVARQDYELVDRKLEPAQKALVLREPQLQRARADVEAAQTAVEHAQLELEWTQVQAPFRARVLDRYVNRGSQVSPQTDLVHLVDVETFWVEASVPQSHLARMEFPAGPDAEGVETVLRNETAWPPGTTRTGQLRQPVGSLEERTRMARILIAVSEPLHPEKPALLLGSYVTVEIPVRELHDVVRLNRDYVRQNDTVWVMREGKLDIREVEVEFRDKTHAFIRDGLTAEEQVVISQLASVVDDARLRTAEEPETSEEPGDDNS